MTEPAVRLCSRRHGLLQVLSEWMHGNSCGPHTSPIGNSLAVLLLLVLAHQCQSVTVNGLHLGVDQDLDTVPAGVVSVNDRHCKVSKRQAGGHRQC